MKYFTAILMLSSLLLLWACTGNISGEASGKYETNTSLEYTETVNGKVVKSIQSKATNGGAGEVEFNIDMGKNDSLNTINHPALNPKITCGEELDDSAVEAIKSQLLQQTLDKKRVLVAKLAMNEYCLSANQIRDVLSLFTMDKYKLEVAKFAYGHCVDRINYGRVKDAFSMTGTKTLLDKYINTL